MAARYTLPVSASKYRDGYLWGAHTVSRDLGDGPVAAIRWFQLDVRSWPTISVVQEGILATRGRWSFHPTLAIDVEQNISVIYMQSGLDQFGSAFYAERKSTDPSGLLPTPITLRAGSGSRTLADAGLSAFGQYLTGSESWGGWVGRLNLHSH